MFPTDTNCLEVPLKNRVGFVKRLSAVDSTEVAEESIRLLRSLAASDSDPWVQYQAGRLLERFTLRLNYGCQYEVPVHLARTYVLDCRGKLICAVVNDGQRSTFEYKRGRALYCVGLDSQTPNCVRLDHLENESEVFTVS